MAVLDSNPAWQGLRAVRDGRVYIADGNGYFNRPGPRLVESAEILAEILHPGHSNYGHMGNTVVQHRPVA
jgi:iron complex transport system substrate-binding protein